MEHSSRARWLQPDHPLWTWLLAAGALATVAPLWSTPLLPFSDLPEHAAQIASLRRALADGAAQPFELDLGHTQYLLYYLAGAGLSLVLGSAERANLALVSLIGLTLPFSLRSLLRGLGKDPRGAFFALPLFWSQPLLIGLVNYLAALPICFWALAVLARAGPGVRWKEQLWLALAFLAIFYLHLSALVVAAPLAVLFAAWQSPAQGSLAARLGAAARRLSFLAPVTLLGLWWLLTSPVVRPSAVGFAAPAAVRFVAPWNAVLHLPFALTDIWVGPWDRYLLFCVAAAFVALALPATHKPSAPAPTRLQRWGPWAAFGLALALYFAMPLQLSWLWLLNDRYALVAALLAPALLQARDSRRAALAYGLVFAVGLGAAVDAAVQIHRCAIELDGAEAVLARAEPGRRLLALYYDERSATARGSPYHHVHALYRARQGGVAEHSFVELPQSPLRYKAGLAPPARPFGWELEPERFDNVAIGPWYDYLFIRGEGPMTQAPPAGPAWRQVERRGAWALYQREP